MGDPTSNYANANHSSQDHLTTQAPPLRQSRDTFGGGGGGGEELKYKISGCMMKLGE